MSSWPYNTSTWQRLRAAKLASEPLCFACNLRGRTEPAVAVDHIKAVSAGGDPFPPFEGLMSLCERCHNEKTNAVDRPDRAMKGRRFKGFDLDGNPIDPADEWHAEARKEKIIPRDGGGTADHERLQRQDRWGRSEDT